MKNIANTAIKLFNYTLLCSLLVPITAAASMEEQVTLGNQPVATSTGMCSESTKVDAVIQEMNHAKSELLKRHSSAAGENLKQAYQELQKLNQEGSGALTERITITHGTQMKHPGYIDTANAYYSPKMQDMRLLKMAESNLKTGNSQAACSELSAVRFPYVSANAQFSLAKTETQARHALTNVQSHHIGNAITDLNKFDVETGSYTSIFQQ